MTNRVLDTALDQAVDVAHGAVNAIGDGLSELRITELLPTQLLPSRRTASRNRGRAMVVVSTMVSVAAALMFVIARRRRRTGNVHRDGSAYEETAEAAMVTGRGAADRVMAAADRSNGEPSALSTSGAG